MRVLVVLVATCATVVVACSGAETSTTSAPAPDEGAPTSITVPDDTVQGLVSGVVSGDTVEVTIGEEVQTIRLAGVRAPQSGECYAGEASLTLSELAAGRTVALVGDGSDDDGVALRYLVIADEVPLLVNVELVGLGAAVALHGHELEGDFLRVNDRAYASGLGMWGTFVCGHVGDSVSPDRPQLRFEEITDAAAGAAAPATVELVNASYTSVAIGGWTVRDAALTGSFTFPGDTVMAAGESLTLTITCAEDAGFAWCVEGDLWAGGGNTLLLQDQMGNVVGREVHAVVGGEE